MNKFAVTGGIGSGKSSVIAALKAYYPDFNFISFDSLVEELYEDEDWKKWLLGKFGVTDRKRVAQIVFLPSNYDLLHQLQTRSGLLLGYSLGQKLSGTGIHVVEFPLLFESGMHAMFDKTVLITADTEVRIARAAARDGQSHDYVRQKIANQMDDKLKLPQADYVIDTTHRDANSAALELVGWFMKLGMQ